MSGFVAILALIEATPEIQKAHEIPLSANIIVTKDTSNSNRTILLTILKVNNWNG